MEVFSFDIKISCKGDKTKKAEKVRWIQQKPDIPHILIERKKCWRKIYIDHITCHDF